MATVSSPEVPNAEAARQHLIDALEADLIGPFRPHAGATWSDAREVLRLPPSRWYLTGFIVPRGLEELQDSPEDQDDELGAGDDADDEDSPSPDPSVKAPRRLPASLGISVLIKPSVKSLKARIFWADYERQVDPAAKEEGARGNRRHQWSRIPHAPVELDIPLDAAALKAGIAIPDSNGLRLEGHLEATRDDLLAVAVFLVNGRTAAEGAGRDESYAFQVRLELHCDDGFFPRANSTDESSTDFDEKVNDLQYRGHCEYAVGHGVAVEAPAGKKVTSVATTWMPKVDVPPVIQRSLKDVEVRMESLASLADPAEAKSALMPLVTAYRTWIDEQRHTSVGDGARTATRKHLMDEAARAATRIEEGIDLLAKDAHLFEAFRLMNGVMAEAERKARANEVPTWRLFQLAFILLNFGSLTSDEQPDRKLVELIFFPTGGGKTQAYLGLIGVTLILRRLRGKSRPDGGLGVAVLLRYTLRLLTLDQLGRAATLICALEILRQKTPSLGEVRFSIGLWVGRSATANKLSEVSRQITEYKNDVSPRAQSPFPLTQCPWCGSEINRDGFILKPSRTSPEEVVVGCGSLECPFNLRRNGDGLPVLFVDEQVYRELPCFLVATVDKFALLPWRGETGMLMGRAQARTGKRFFGPCDDQASLKKATQQLPSGLRPPDLIVQDELHLISGPLGSMVGLYEAALLALCPNAKIVASTATVRRARDQVQRLYGRELALFPPPGVDASETFFAQVSDKGARRYVGVAAPGRPMKTVQLRTYVALLAAAARVHDGSSSGASPADAYLTLVGYFNSLRELGGMRRLVEDEVRKQVMERERRRPLDFPDDERHPWFKNRSIKAEPVELTSREKTLAIKESKARLSVSHGQKDSVDVVLASNMISVGVDIDRLGLMVIAGQPKTTSEYIQSSSRVGRKASRPGLVVTCLNLNKPRDRSHYERFQTYHQSFYRFVEATSVTPFSGPALDRGLAGVVVALGRLADIVMTAPFSVMSLRAHREQLEQRMTIIAERAGMVFEAQQDQERARDHVMKRIRSLLDSWEAIIADAKKAAGQRAYSPLDPAAKGTKPILHTVLDTEDTWSGDEHKFIAPLSMRDVEPSVHLWVTRQPLGGYKPRAALTEDEKNG